jgi:hypothetical protein
MDINPNPRRVANLNEASDSILKVTQFDSVIATMAASKPAGIGYKRWFGRVHVDADRMTDPILRRQNATHVLTAEPAASPKRDHH